MFLSSRSISLSPLPPMCPMEGGVNALEGEKGGQYRKKTNIWKRWGVHDLPPAPMVAPPLHVSPIIPSSHSPIRNFHYYLNETYFRIYSTVTELKYSLESIDVGYSCTVIRKEKNCAEPIISHRPARLHSTSDSSHGDDAQSQCVSCEVYSSPDSSVSECSIPTTAAYICLVKIIQIDSSWIFSKLQHSNNDKLPRNSWTRTIAAPKQWYMRHFFLCAISGPAVLFLCLIFT